MASARALLAAERAARRLTHPYLHYDQSGRLQCTVCNLNIPAEKLWEPHLRSANHRKNAAAREEGFTVSKKRKIDDGSEEPIVQKRKHEETDDGMNEAKQRVQTTMTSRGAKRVKSVRFEDQPTEVPEHVPPVPTRETDKGSPPLSNTEHETPESEPQVVPEPTEPQISSSSHEVPIDPVDEDEWAAFERDLAPLTSFPATNTQTHDRYSHATISAPAVSAADLPKTPSDQAHAENKTKRRDYEAEAQAEREEEQARLQEEFEVMEEMEERVRRLREMREKLRVRSSVASGAQQEAGITDTSAKQQMAEKVVEEDEDESDELDDWFS